MLVCVAIRTVLIVIWLLLRRTGIVFSALASAVLLSLPFVSLWLFILIGRVLACTFRRAIPRIVLLLAFLGFLLEPNKFRILGVLTGCLWLNKR